MMTYVAAFIFYTLAMVGILLIGFVVYKKTFDVSKGENRGLIKVIDSTPIGNKKMLLAVKVKNETFLIASGMEHTTFLAKLDDNSSKKKNSQQQDDMEISENSSYTSNSDYNLRPQENYNGFQKSFPQDIYNEPQRSVVQEQYRDTQYPQNNYYEQNNQPKERYDDPERARVQAIQQQFRELYEQEDQVQKAPVNPEMNRREIAKQLFRTMKMNSKSGSKF